MHHPQNYVNSAQILLAIFIAGFNTTLLLVHIGAILYTRLVFHRKVPFTAKQVEDGLPGVSIIKPLVGIDKNVYVNLETFFKLSYPRFELLFCLESEDDVVKMVVETLIERYPSVDARVLCKPQRCGVNPKVNNMIQGYGLAKYDLVMISDSGIRTNQDIFNDMVQRMIEREDVGLVHQMPFVEQRSGFGNVVHSVFFGGTHAKLYTMANFLGFNCSTGMSVLLRKDVLDLAPGGLAFFGRYLAEDFFVCRHFHSQGYRLVLSRFPALQDGKQSIGDLRRRLMRWSKLRLAMIPLTILLEPLTECLLSGLLGSLSISVLLPAVNPYVFFLIHCLVWLILDYLLVKGCIHDSQPPFSRLTFLCAWVFCAFMSPLNLLSAQLLQSDVVWRGHRFQLLWGGITKEILPEKQVL